MADIQPTPTASPTPKVGQYDSLLSQVVAKYPAFKSLPLSVTAGRGPGFAETYGPKDELNPNKGKWTIQLRSRDWLANPNLAAQGIASESIHALAQEDKTYKGFHDEFKKSMTPEQLSMAKEAYAQEKKMFGSGKGGVGSFNDWMDDSRVEAYVRGGLFPQINSEWQRPGTYTPQQIQILGKIHNYLTTGK